ncbi:MAG: hypothetical protein BGP12_20410 [Rhodospirillales bacterium 70-18]|nr:hypothetical protein [Rhodospirillales bacterium]OJY67846.1 MAG: hypothetical protein BGP12_20410 [Rhodospirillales bacterium 70-18]
MVLACLMAPAHAQPVAPSAPGDLIGADTRLVKIIQLGPAEQPMGDPVEVACPASGCQALLPLTVDSLPERFLLSIQFVSAGTYVTLQPRSIGTAEILDFEKGRKGAIFLPAQGRSRQQVTLNFIIVRDASVRALEGHTNGQTLASGNVFNRKRQPDVVLRLELAPPGG